MFEFSVIMAVYNTEEFLRDALESLEHQTYGFEKIQIILVDDGSKDTSGKICDEYAAKYASRKGGYTRIVKIGERRGDGAMKVILELV